MEGLNPGEEQNRAHRIFCRVCLLLAFIAVAYHLVSCGVQKPMVTQRDSMRIVIRERLVRDTARIEVPRVVERIVTRDTASILDNEWARSEASVSDGLLRHSLESKPRILRIPVTVPVHDTLIVERNAETVYVDAPRQLTKWESFLEVCGWILLGAVALAVLCLILRTVLRR